MPADWAGPVRKPAPRYRPWACRRSSRTGPSRCAAQTDRAARPAMEQDRRQRTARTRRNGRIFAITTQDSENDAVRLPLVLLARIGARLERPRAGRHRRHLRHALPRGIARDRFSNRLRAPGLRRSMACDNLGGPRALGGRGTYREQCRTAAHLVRKERSIRPRDTGLNELLDRITAVRQSRDQGYGPLRNGGGPQLVAQTQRLRAVVEQRDNRLLAGHPQR